MSAEDAVFAIQPLAVFVDDNEAYLGALRLFFPESQSNCFFSCPRTALEYIRTRRDLTPQLGSRNGDGATGPLAAVVVDSTMPGLSGTDFLRALGQVQCTRVLLTGVADERVAEQAFSSGVLDFYLSKSDMDFIEKLKVIVARARRVRCDTGPGTRA